MRAESEILVPLSLPAPFLGLLLAKLTTVQETAEDQLEDAGPVQLRLIKDELDMARRIRRQIERTIGAPLAAQLEEAAQNRSGEVIKEWGFDLDRDDPTATP